MSVQLVVVEAEGDRTAQLPGLSDQVSQLCAPWAGDLAQELLNLPIPLDRLAAVGRLVAQLVMADPLPQGDYAVEHLDSWVFSDQDDVISTDLTIVLSTLARELVAEGVSGQMYLGAP